MEYLTIAKIVKPHGYRGAVKIKSETRDEIDYMAINEFYIDEKSYKIEDAFLAGGEFVIKFEGIDNAMQVNALRGKEIQISSEDYFSNKADDEVLVSELVDACVVLDDGTAIGNISSVENFGASDLFFIKSQKYTNLIVPNVKNIVESFEKGKKQIIMNKKIFFEVMTCDEN